MRRAKQFTPASSAQASDRILAILLALPVLLLTIDHWLGTAALWAATASLLAAAADALIRSTALATYADIARRALVLTAWVLVLVAALAGAPISLTLEGAVGHTMAGVVLATFALNLVPEALRLMNSVLDTLIARDERARKADVQR